MNKLLRIIMLVTASFTLASCLSMEVEVDLRDEHDLRLSLEYRIPIDLWELGVFDQESMERAIPVSRRDAQETATLHPDVTLDKYHLEEGDGSVVITVTYKATSINGLRGLWGEVANQPMELSYENKTVSLPLSGGHDTGTADAEQRDLISQLFTDQTFSLILRLPADVVSQDFPALTRSEVRSTDPDVLEWRVPMGELLLSPQQLSVVSRWR